jgi:hypothetical protein
MFRVAINTMALTGKLPAGDSRWAAFNDSFRNRTLSRIDLLDAIVTGHAYTTWHNGRRKLENFELAQHIAVDFDTGDERSAIDKLIQHDMVRLFAGMIHTTPSHTKARPRCRVIFILDNCITDADAYAEAATFLIHQFDGADDACKDASRFFYGMGATGDTWMTDNVLPLRMLRRMYRAWAVRNPQRAVVTPVAQAERIYKPHDYADWTELLIDPVRHAPEGDRNNTLNKQAFFAGKDIRKGRISETDIVPHLIWAAQLAGLSEAEAMRTIASGIRGGKAAM